MSTPHVLTDDNVKELTELMGGDKQAMEFVRALRRMEQGAALSTIEDTIPQASYDLKTGLVNLIPEHEYTVPMPLGKQYAVLWLCGTTYGQIAQLYGISKQTAQSSSARYLTPDVRKEYREQRSKFTTNISHTQVAAYRQILLQWLSTADRFKMMTQGSVTRIAIALMQEYRENQELLEEDAPSPYDALINAPESRLGSS